MTVLGSWGAPPDGVALAALVGAVAVGVLAYRGTRIDGGSERWFLTVCGFAAAFLSLGYVAYYLRGGPRIIDASTYYLQARALSEGHLSWAVPEPTASFRGRFLVFHDGSISGIFPPGYPLVLSLGFLIGAPMLVGPLLGAALVIATYALAKEIGDETTARMAALFSLASAALRYHTADTMSHGATALWITCALVCVLRARRTRSGSALLGAGLAVGMTLATRPISAIPIALVTVGLLWRSLPRVALGAVPGVLLLLLAQRSATGSALTSTQLAYYATSDGPPGCFRYGFGHGIGCLLEHGDFVRARLPDGYGLVAAAGTTLRRLHLHLSDAFNAWPLGLVFVAVLPRTVRVVPRSRALAVVVGLQVLAYAPFYFDGNYPGGGARLLADVLPLELVLMAVALADLTLYGRITDSLSSPPAPLPHGRGEKRSLAPSPVRERAGGEDSGRRRSVSVGRGSVNHSMAWLALMLLGFAIHGAFDHRALAERDGGRPMFEDADLKNAGATRGLVFVDSDHAFGLAHDPAFPGLTVARTHGDGHDRLLYESLGKPPTYLHHYDEGTVTVVPYRPPEDAWRFEAEAEWPPLEQRGAYAIPLWASGTCASGSKALEVVPGEGGGEVVIALPVPRAGSWEIVVRTFEQGTGGRGELHLAGTSMRWAERADGALQCNLLSKVVLPLDAGELRVVVHAEGAPVSLDRIELTPSP